MNWLIRHTANIVEGNTSGSKNSLSLCFLCRASLNAIWSVLVNFNQIQLESAEWVTWSEQYVL